MKGIPDRLINSSKFQMMLVFQLGNLAAALTGFIGPVVWYKVFMALALGWMGCEAYQKAKEVGPKKGK